MSGLPNVIVNDLEIYYPTEKLRAGTYGRGTWETDLYSDPLAAPFAFYTLASAKPPAVVSVMPVERAPLAPVESSEREYLFAHQAMAPAAGMPGVAHYVRTVSDTRVAGER